jgi:hypothetical protein
MKIMETVVLRYKEREREGEPSSYYLRTRRSVVNYSRIIGEAARMM